MAAAALTGAAQNSQRLVVETVDGKKSSFPTSEIAGVLFENAPEYVNTPHLLRAVYSTSGENGSYSFDVSDYPADEWGYPSGIGGVLAGLTLVGPLSQDRYGAVLPEGYYRVGQASNQFTINIAKSQLYVRLAEGADGATPMMIVDGTADVRHAAGGYDIRMELVDMAGEAYNLRYEGPLKFDLASSDYEQLTEDQDITFTGGQGRFYSNWSVPFSCDMTLQFYSGEFDSNDVMIDGFWLNLPIYMPKVKDEMNPVQKLADGTYRMETRTQIQNHTNMPYTFEKGALIDFLGTPAYIGTYLTVVKKDGRRYMALVTDGTFTVSGDGTKVVLDFVTDNGTKIKGSFDGKINIHNFCDNDEKAPKRPYSLLKGDVNLNFPPNAIGILYQEPESYLENMGTYQLLITEPDMKYGDFMMITYFSKSESLENGTYTIDSKFDDHSVAPGTIDFGGQMFLSWYGDLSEVDDEGYNTKIAPFNGGTFTVTDGKKAGTKTITFDVIDDNGHKIKGSWTGEIEAFLPDNDSTAPKKLRVR